MCLSFCEEMQKRLELWLSLRITLFDSQIHPDPNAQVGHKQILIQVKNKYHK